MVLRHIYPTATAISTDGTSFVITKDFVVEPATSPETSVASAQDLTILADATNGTNVYDVDQEDTGTLTDFSTIASTLEGKFVRVAARFQPDGKLVAVRAWVSTSFNKVWLSSEGHALHVDTIGDIVTVQNELGVGVPVTVGENTEYYFRTPGSAVEDATSIGAGIAFLSNVVRGLKVHVSSWGPGASTMLAHAIDIEIARFEGGISDADGSGFTAITNFSTGTGDYSPTLP
jgi:hypothetical protein